MYPREVVKRALVLNAGAAIYAANLAPTLADGVNKARAAIESGAAKPSLLYSALRFIAAIFLFAVTVSISAAVNLYLICSIGLMALQIAHRGYVLETGEVALSDTAENLRQNEVVQKVYLGIA